MSGELEVWRDAVEVVRAEGERRTEVPIERPDVPPAWAQLGVLVLDGSESMTWSVDGGDHAAGTKAQAVHGAVRDLFARFKSSSRAANFSFAVVTFHETADVRCPVTRLVNIDPFADYDPTSRGTGGTFVGGGLEVAHRICRDFLDADHRGLPASAVILLMTDGECGNVPATDRVAAAIGEDPRITVAGAFFATKGQQPIGADALRRWCTDPVRFFTMVYDGETLRRFWIASMESVAVGRGTPASRR